MRYKCQKLVACHVPVELANALDDVADSELMSRSQVVRDSIVYYLSNREANNGDIRSTRKKMLQNDLWGKLFGQ